MNLKIKEALLSEEVDKIKLFLSRFDLDYDEDIDYSLYIEDEDEIVATISKAGYIIKALAVTPSYQGYNLASKLVLAIIIHLKEAGISYYQVYTKQENKHIFTALNFSHVITTDKISFFESPTSTIKDCLTKLKKEYNINTKNNGTIVINGNPLTNGHLYLIKEAAKHHETLIIFIVEEDLSDFNFNERLLMMKNATKDINNVVVIPSTRYIISRSTFPTYFIKEDSERSSEYAKVDVNIFKEYFMKIFNISKRYIGAETNPMMVMYNYTLKTILKDKLVLIDRLEQDQQVVSASLVRSYMKQGKVKEALKMIPKVNHEIIINKYKGYN